VINVIFNNISVILHFTFIFSLFVFVSAGTCIIILDIKYNIANSSCHLGHMAVYGPVRHQKNIIWTSAALRCAIGCTATADFHIVLKMEIFLNSTPFNIAFYRITSPWSYCTFLFDIFHTYVGLLIYI
jgi:hypothetical protein